MSNGPVQTTLPVELNGRKLVVDVSHHERFWRRFAAGLWEPDTIRILNERIDRDTTYIDVGAWIGPTVLYAAQGSKSAHAFEPDCVAFEELQINLALNPQIKNLSIHKTFVGSCDGEVTMGSRTQPGDSMSSALFSAGASAWRAKSMTLDQFAEEIQLRSPVFVKVDVEGWEYSLMPSLRHFALRHKPTLLLSLHPAFFAMLTEGQSLGRKVLRRARLLRAHYRLAQFLSVFDEVRTLHGDSLGIAAALTRVAIGRRFAPGNVLLAFSRDSTAVRRHP